MALRRFITRQGKPYELLCDQGTNFKGGEQELSESFAAMQDELQSHPTSQQIKFVYNPPVVLLSSTKIMTKYHRQRTFIT